MSETIARTRTFIPKTNLKHDTERGLGSTGTAGCPRNVPGPAVSDTSWSLDCVREVGGRQTKLSSHDPHSRDMDAESNGLCGMRRFRTGAVTVTFKSIGCRRPYAKSFGRELWQRGDGGRAWSQVPLTSSFHR